MSKIIFRTDDLFGKEVDTFPNKIDGVAHLIQYAWNNNRFNHPFGIECQTNEGHKNQVFFYTHCPQLANKIVKDFGAESATLDT